MAKLRFPKAMALLYLSAYGKCPDAARVIPMIFNVITNVKSFLENTFRMKSERWVDVVDTCLYVLNHNCQRIHLETFFLVDGFIVRGFGIEITSLDASRGVSTFIWSLNARVVTLDGLE
jgi:hypothetical protein